MLKAWPTLTSDEFTDACLQFETSAFGRLDGTDWLSLRWDDATGALYIKKQCQIAARGDAFVEEETDVENELTDLEDDVGVPFASSRKFLTQLQSILRRLVQTPTVTADFSIILSPTYQVPVLWIILPDLPRDGPQGVDAVYHYFVPPTSKAQVKDIGVIGGISIAVCT